MNTLLVGVMTMSKEVFKAGLLVDLRSGILGKPINAEMEARICGTVRRWLEVALTHRKIQKVPKDIGVMFLPHMHTARVMVGPLDLWDWLDDNWTEPGTLRFRVPISTECLTEQNELLEKLRKEGTE